MGRPRWFLIFLILNSPLGFAGNGGSGIGNGGDVVVCEKGDWKKIESLDLYEAKNIYFWEPKLPSNDRDPWSLARFILNRMNNLSEPKAAEFLRRLDQMKDDSIFANDLLLDLPDTGDLVLPPNCTVKQQAIRIPSRVPYGKQYYIYKPYWDFMDPVNQAALIAHEIIFGFENDLGATDSKHARFITAFLISDPSEFMPATDLFEIVKKESFHDFRSWWCVDGPLDPKCIPPQVHTTGMPKQVFYQESTTITLPRFGTYKSKGVVGLDPHGSPVLIPVIEDARNYIVWSADQKKSAVGTFVVKSGVQLSVNPSNNQVSCPIENPDLCYFDQIDISFEEKFAFKTQCTRLPLSTLENLFSQQKDFFANSIYSECQNYEFFDGLVKARKGNQVSKGNPFLEDVRVQYYEKMFSLKQATIKDQCFKFGEDALKTPVELNTSKGPMEFSSLGSICFESGHSKRLFPLLDGLVPSKPVRWKEPTKDCIEGVDRGVLRFQTTMVSSNPTPKREYVILPRKVADSFINLKIIDSETKNPLWFDEFIGVRNEKGKEKCLFGFDKPTVKYGTNLIYQNLELHDIQLPDTRSLFCRPSFKDQTGNIVRDPHCTGAPLKEGQFYVEFVLESGRIQLATTPGWLPFEKGKVGYYEGGGFPLVTTEDDANALDLLSKPPFLWVTGYLKKSIRVATKDLAATFPKKALTKWIEFPEGSEISFQYDFHEKRYLVTSKNQLKRGSR